MAIHQVGDARGQAVALEHAEELARHRGRLFGGLEQQRVAEGERGRDLPCGDGDGEVPRRDQADHADRLAAGLHADVRPHRREVLAAVAHGLAGEEAEDLAGPRDFADAFGARLAGFPRDQLADLLAAREELVRRALQQVAADLRGRCRPGRLGGARGRHGLADLCRVGERELAHHVVGIRRIDAGDRFLAGDPFAADEVLLNVHGPVSWSAGSLADAGVGAKWSDHKFAFHMPSNYHF